MKKIDLITGFLGAGKTTFLKEYVKYLVSIGEKVCILENDFGAVNVDMMLVSELRGENCELEMVSGGCDSDCHKRRFKTKLIAMGMDDYTRIVVEPSGVFDVDEFFDSLYDEPLCNWYEVGSVIGIVDAAIDTDLSENARYVLASEMSMAGKIIFSKVKNAGETQIGNTKKFVQKAINEVGCKRDVTSDFMEKDLFEFSEKDFENIMKSGYKKESFIKKSGEFDGFNSVYFLDNKIAIEDIKNIAKNIINDKTYGNVIRLKGFCYSNGIWIEINADKSRVMTREVDVGQDVFIVIGENLDEERIKEEVGKYVEKTC